VVLRKTSNQDIYNKSYLNAFFFTLPCVFLSLNSLFKWLQGSPFDPINSFAMMNLIKAPNVSFSLKHQKKKGPL
jgi:hypothetical protein